MASLLKQSTSNATSVLSNVGTVANATASLIEIGVQFPIVGAICTVFNTIYTMAEQAKKNKANCKKAAKRCKVYEGIIIECANAHRANGVSEFNRQQNKGLRDFKGSVEDLLCLVQKYSSVGKLKRFLNSVSFRQEFEEIDHEIEQYLQIVQLHLSKEAVKQNNELLKRTTALMEVDAKLAYVLNNQVAIETMTRLNYDKNTEILSMLRSEFDKINTGKSNDLNQILSMLKDQQALLSNIDNENDRALTENALQQVIDMKSKVGILLTKADFDIANQEQKDQFLQITSSFNTFHDEQRDMFLAIKKMDVRQDLIKTNVDIVKSEIFKLRMTMEQLTSLNDENQDNDLSPDAKQSLKDMQSKLLSSINNNRELMKSVFDTVETLRANSQKGLFYMIEANKKLGDLKETVDAEFNVIKSQLVQIQNGNATNFNEILNQLNQLSLNDQKLSDDAAGYFDDVKDDLEKLAKQSERLGNNFSIADKRNAKKMMNLLENLEELKTSNENGQMFVIEKINNVIKKQDEVIKITREQNETLRVLEEKETLNYDINEQILKLVRQMVPQQAEENIVNEDTDVEISLKEQVDDIEKQLSHIDPPTEEDVQEDLTIASSLEISIPKLEKELEESRKAKNVTKAREIHVTIVKEKKQFELVDGRLRLILHFNKWMSRLVKELQVKFDNAFEANDYNEADRVKLIHEKATKLLEVLRTRFEMKFIWDVRKKKGFAEEDKWGDYEYCVNGNFTSKSEMTKARDDGFSNRADFIAYTNLGFYNYREKNDYEYCVNGNFTSKSEMTKARDDGFSNRADFIAYTNLGFYNYREKNDYEYCVNGNFTSKSEMTKARDGGFSNRADFIAYKTLNEKYKKEFPKGTPLVCACEKGRVEDVEGMIRGARAAGMDVTAMVSELGTDSDGYSNTPLMMAAYNEHSTIIEILLQYNADTATTNNNGLNALHWAAYNKTTTTTVQLLLNNMKLEDINHKDINGDTPLDNCYEYYNNSSIKQQLIDLIRQKGGKRKSEL